MIATTQGQVFIDPADYGVGQITTWLTLFMPPELPPVAAMVQAVEFIGPGGRHSNVGAHWFTN